MVTDENYSPLLYKWKGLEIGTGTTKEALLEIFTPAPLCERTRKGGLTNKMTQ